MSVLVRCSCCKLRGAVCNLAGHSGVAPLCTGCADMVTRLYFKLYHCLPECKGLDLDEVSIWS